MTPDKYYNSAPLTYKSFEHMSIDLKNEIIAEIEIKTDEILDLLTQACNGTLADDYIKEIKIPQIIKLLEQIDTNTQIIIAIGAFLAVLGIIIILNQRKIKKQLRQLLDQKEDKPE